jgi:hypothetical protein
VGQTTGCPNSSSAHSLKVRIDLLRLSPMGDPFYNPMSLKRIIRKAILWYSLRNRNRKAIKIVAWLAIQGVRDVLFVGAMGEEHGSNSNMVNVDIVEKRIAEQFNVKMGINLTSAITPYPFMIASACDMPFETDYVDFALANAIIEHVGFESEQKKMVEEMTRVARSWVITTPNKWFPIESHTSALFLHWIPSWRKRHSDDFSRLLSRREFRNLLPPEATLIGMPWSPTFTAYFTRK